MLGGFFLSLSYFGADQSQVQRYLAGGSLQESRIGLLFNAIVKVPMQFLILLLGAMVFLFYQFEKPPVYFNQPAYQRAMENGYGPQLTQLQTQFDDVFARKRDSDPGRCPPPRQASATRRLNELRELDAQAHALRDQTKAVLVQAGVESEEQGFRLRFHHFYSSTSAARSCRITHRSDLLRHDVRNGSNS